jgi:UDP-N-acetyl-D-glucosamine/UDP-N-acetyl-D-galactosamine dehydrogenase
MYEELITGKKKISLIGLGYVGLPIALEFAKKVPVIGFDIKPDRVEMMKKNIDPSRELDSSAFEGCDIYFTANPADLAGADFHIVAVPTPIDDHNLPDLTPVLKASETVGKILKKGDYVIYESTVYPGCTEEDCIPVLEKHSGLKFKEDFKVGFSPERINPGDKEHTLTKIVKVVSGCDDESLENIAKTYELIIEAGVHRAGSIKVAEAAKIIENTQRDINIAFMNELSMIFNKMDINTNEVLEAAGTKWNFLRFYPGLVGGHCIGVDPYYLTYKAKEFGYHAQIINAGRYINDSMGRYVARQTLKRLSALDKNITTARILIMGITFKENVSDIRNSKVADVYNELLAYGAKNIDVVDPHASSDEVKEEYGFELKEKPVTNYDAVIVAVNHEEYLGLTVKDFRSLTAESSVLVDVKSTYRQLFKSEQNGICYWSL